MTDSGVTDLLDRLRTALADRYALERKVGEGGMATVYFARDLAHDRDVAVKVLRPELASSLGGDRFLREIAVAAKLDHPNILGMYESGQVDEFLYFTMPFVVGESLHDRIVREGQLPLEDALRITRQVASALAFAHAQGIIHRDIKPENIMVSGDRAIVADFGIARAVTQAGGERLTRTGMAVGTPVYMSPEQSAGDKIDGRSDLYSLACVLYEMLVGQPPFTGSNPMTLMARHSMEAVPSVQLVRQTVPDQVEDVLMKALAKSPADRYATLEDFRKALDGAESGKSTRGGSRARALRKRRMIMGGIGAALAVAGTFGAWKLMAPPAAAAGPGPGQLAVLYFEDRSPARDQAFLADGLTEALINELSQVSVLQVISRNGVAPYKTLTVAPDSIARALNVGTIVQGTVATVGDSVRVEVTLVDTLGKQVGGSIRLLRPRTELFALQDDIAREISLKLRVRVGQQVDLSARRAGTRNVQAWELEQQALQTAKGADSLIALGNAAAASREMLRVDSMLARVETMDGRWTAPIVTRANLGFRQARTTGDYAKWIAPGLAHAERAVALQPRDADALEARASLNYLKWLTGGAADKTEAARLLSSAEGDFRAAVAANPSQASAWATLSHLLAATSKTAEAKVAALRAYEADPYLTNASVIVWRLFQNSLDLDDGPEASRWCAEGQRRFGGDPRFVECQIWLYSLKSTKPDVPRVWELLGTYTEETKDAWRANRAGMLVAMALARANLPDSAKAVATRSRMPAASDPTRELAFLESIVRTLVGDRDEALRLLGEFYEANPQQREGLANDQSWWFTSLRTDPRYQALIAPR